MAEEGSYEEDGIEVGAGVNVRVKSFCRGGVERLDQTELAEDFLGVCVGDCGEVGDFQKQFWW